MDSYYAVGHLDGIENGTVTGWARSEDRPAERLMIEILADDKVVASALADQFRADLVVRSRFDGQHGFSLRPHETRLPPGTQLVSARDKVTQRIFARVRIGSPRTYPDQNQRLDHLERELLPVREMLDAGVADTHMNDHLRSTFGVLGQRLCNDDGGSFLRATAHLASLLSGISCPFVANPALTVVLLAGSVAETVSTMMRADALFAADGYELLIVDRFDDPLIKLMPTVLPAIGVVDGSIRRGFAESMICADEMARASRLVVFESGLGLEPASVSTTAPSIAFSRERMIIGPSADREAFAGLDGLTTHMVDGMTTMLFCVERSLFRLLGGIDPRLGGMPRRAAAELGLRATLCGAAPLWLVEQTAGSLKPAPHAAPPHRAGPCGPMPMKSFA